MDAMEGTELLQILIHELLSLVAMQAEHDLGRDVSVVVIYLSQQVLYRLGCFSLYCLTMLRTAMQVCV